MKKLVTVSAITLLSVSTLCLAATPLKSLDKKETTQLFSDQTMTTANLVTIDNKLVNNTLTAYWGKDGSAKGSLTNKPDSGQQSDEGTWMVKNNGAMCVTWQHWNNNKPICVYVYKTNNTYLFINENNHNLESMAMKDDFKSGNQLG